MGRCSKYDDHNADLGGSAHLTSHPKNATPGHSSSCRRQLFYLCQIFAGAFHHRSTVTTSTVYTGSLHLPHVSGANSHASTVPSLVYCRHDLTMKGLGSWGIYRSNRLLCFLWFQTSNPCYTRLTNFAGLTCKPEKTTQDFGSVQVLFVGQQFGPNL